MTLLKEECFKIHKLVFHRNQHFEEGQRPVEHSCRKEKEKIKCRTLINTNIQRESKYRYKKDKEYSDIENF